VVLLVVACLGGVKAQNSTVNTTAVDVCPTAKWRVSIKVSVKQLRASLLLCIPRCSCELSNQHRAYAT
jgi:hypothetical protein